MKIYVINLPKDKERKSFQEKQLKSFNLDYEVISAVTVADISKQTYEAHRDDWQRPLRNVEIACFYSHYHLWQRILEQNKPALILEDDALLSKKLPHFLQKASSLKEIDFINLESVGRKKIVSRKPIQIEACDTSLLHLYLDRNGAGGYILFPSGAKKLLTFAKQGIGLADAHIRSCPQLSSFQAEPILVIQMDQCHKVGITAPITMLSNITDTNKPPIPFQKQLVFKYKRLKEQLRQGIIHIRYALGTEKRKMTIVKKDFIP